MKRMQRYDTGSLEVLERGDGFLRARVRIARDGVFPYLYPDGSIRHEAKLEEELTKDSTIQSAKGKPITDNHPPKDDSRGLVTPANAMKYVRGALGDSITVSREGSNIFLDGVETIFDAGLIDKVLNGEKVELSIGFDCRLDDTPGEYKGVRYDVAQRDMEINHIAHVEKGRAGESCRVYLDSADDVAVMMEDTHARSDEMTVKNSRADEKSLFKILKDFFTKTDEDDIPPEEDPKKTPVAPATDDVALLKDQIAALKVLLDEKTKALEEMTKNVKEATSPETLDSLISARTKVITAAKSIVPDIKTDGMTDRALKLAVIEKALPFASGVKTDSVDDVAINTRFDAALELMREKAAVRGDDIQSETRLDEAEIEKKRDARLHMQDMK